MKTYKYAVIIEKVRGGYGAYVPDLPVCAAFAKTDSEVRRLIKSAIGFHVRGLRSDGDPIPRPSASVGYIQFRLASQSITL